MTDFAETRRMGDESETVFREGQRFGEYRLLQCVGIGASGEIWKARDPHGSIVALKLLVRRSQAARDQVRRFIREGNVLSGLRHQGICRTYEMRSAEGVLYIAMEYVEGIGLGRLLSFLADPSSTAALSLARDRGDTIGTIIDTIDGDAAVSATEDEDATAIRLRSGPARLLPLQQSLSIVMKLCAAIQFAHERGVLHRDIKPSNIIIRRSGEPVILDFGIAKVRSGGDPALTETGKVFGTIEYMAPEQARASREIDERADVYSIGAVLYQLVTGRKHFVRSGELYRDVRRLDGYEPIRPRLHSKGIDRELEAILLKALDPNPARRYRSAKQLAEDLRRYQSSEPIMAKRATPTYLLWKFLAKYRLPVSFTAAIVALLTLFAGYFLWDYYRQWGSWKQVYHRDFTAAPYPSEDFVFIDRKGEVTKPWKADSLGLRMKRFETCWLRDVRVAGGVRVVMGLRYGSSPDGVELVINGTEDSLAAWYHVPRGYSCQYGGYYGSLAHISVNEQAGFPGLSDFAYLTPPVGRPVELVFERRDDEIVLSVDGERILAEEHSLPFEGAAFSRIGFRCYSTTVHVQTLDVYHLALPERVSPLVAGDALVAEGFVEKGIRSYLETAGDFRGHPLGARSLARAFVAASRLRGERWHSTADSIKTLLGRDYPKSPQWETVDEAELIRLWHDERYDEVLGRLEAHCAKHPDTDIAQRLLRSAPDSVKVRLLPFLRRLGRFVEIDVDSLGLTSLEDLKGCDPLKLCCTHNHGLTDLSPLAGMDNLMWLECGGNAIEELGPLEGKPLFLLDGSRNRIRDIAALHGAPLRFLHLKDNYISDLAPLEGSRARSLALDHNLITDLSPLRDLPAVVLGVDHNRIADLSPLSGMGLSRLSCQGNRIGSLYPLKGMPLTHLSCGGNPLTDLSPLSGMRLRELWATGCRITSLSPLSDMPLDRLGIDRTGVSDLSSLRGLRLSYLDCRGNRIASLWPLSDMPLTVLMCGDNPLESLEALEGMPLRYLSVSNHSHPGPSSIGSLEPLAGMGISRLDCMNQRITSLEPLRGMPIDTLNCQGNPLRSLEPFIARPPTEFYFYSETMPLHELRRAEERWGRDSSTAPLARRARIYRMVRTEQWSSLIEMATPVRGRRYLFVPIFVSHEDARANARKAGGRLLVVRDPEERDSLRTLVNDGAWLGLRRDKGHWEWETGEPVRKEWREVLRRDWREGGEPYLDESGEIRLCPADRLRPLIIEWSRR